MSRPRIVCILLALVTLLVYLPVRHYAFVDYDDDTYVTENPVVQTVNGSVLTGLIDTLAFLSLSSPGSSTFSW